MAAELSLLALPLPVPAEPLSLNRVSFALHPEFTTKLFDFVRLEADAPVQGGQSD